jgi:transketolase
MNSLDLARKARIHSLKMVHKATASHIGSSLSIIDILSVLYSGVMNIYPLEPSNPDRDRFILSKGHACVSVYAILAECGFFKKEILQTFGKNGSVLMNHISNKVPGVEFSTGSLGHGLPFGVGISLSAKKMKKHWYTYVLLSDGEMQEGSNWEAFMFSAHHKLDNLVAIIDYNNLQSLTTVEKTLNIHPLNDKLKSFGWHVIEVDGHNHNSLKKCFKDAILVKNKPTVIIALTTKGKGVSFMENKVEWHYKSPNVKELDLAINEIENA